jgi:hypothetical protein
VPQDIQYKPPVEIKAADPFQKCFRCFAPPYFFCGEQVALETFDVSVVRRGMSA